MDKQWTKISKEICKMNEWQHKPKIEVNGIVNAAKISLTPAINHAVEMYSK